MTCDLILLKPQRMEIGNIFYWKYKKRFDHVMLSCVFPSRNYRESYSIGMRKCLWDTNFLYIKKAEYISKEKIVSSWNCCKIVLANCNQLCTFIWCPSQPKLKFAQMKSRIIFHTTPHIPKITQEILKYNFDVILFLKIMTCLYYAYHS